MRMTAMRVVSGLAGLGMAAVALVNCFIEIQARRQTA